ncbi:MAG: replicative DNA helicase [Paracoccaceae bacterium]|nr:replicative DNA helicase [Paracoccaceae bacterium]MDE2916888.1 replicative DNA helicase [Paracoccaceae bacterium]
MNTPALFEISQQEATNPLSDDTIPQSLVHEKALISALLFNNEIYTEISKIIQPEHFYFPVNKIIFEKIVQLIQQYRLASHTTLWPYIQNEVEVIESGGRDYLKELIAVNIAPSKAHAYAREIRELAIRRGIINVGNDLTTQAIDQQVDNPTTDIINDAESKLYQLRNFGREESDFQDFSKHLIATIERAKIATENEDEISGLSTELIDLDNFLGGLQPSDLIIIAGRPGMGKTALATNIAYSVAKNFKDPSKIRKSDPLGGKVAIFSLEMSGEQLASRILAEVSEVPATKIRKNQIGKAEFEKYAKASMDLVKLPLYIDDTAGLTIADISLRCNRLHRRTGGLGLLVVDYIQLIQGMNRKENRTLEIAEITGGLKKLAKDLNIPVIGVSQLSRSIETREDKRPQMSDLRDSGSIEQDADLVMFVYREEYYLKRSEPSPEDEKKFETWKANMNKHSNKAEIIIDKNRHGPVGSIRTTFNGRLTKFGNLAESSQLAGEHEISFDDPYFPSSEPPL